MRRCRSTGSSPRLPGDPVDLLGGEAEIHSERRRHIARPGTLPRGDAHFTAPPGARPRIARNHPPGHLPFLGDDHGYAFIDTREPLVETSLELACVNRDLTTMFHAVKYT